jgi:hypothetical protein
LKAGSRAFGINRSAAASFPHHFFPALLTFCDW